MSNPRATSRPRAAWLAVPFLALVAIATALGGAAEAAPTAPTVTVINTDGQGVAARNAPNQGAVTGYGAPAGAVVTTLCWTTGDPVGPYANPLWWKVNYDGREFFAPDRYLSTPYTAESTPTEPSCDSSTPAAPAAPAAPANVSCFGDYCSGQDPHTTGCDEDAVTVATVYDDKGSGKLDLRWSGTCQTNWARWQQYPTGLCLVCQPLAIAAEQDTGYQEALTFGGMGDDGPLIEDGGTYWTPMIYSPVHGVKARAQMSCGAAGIVGTAFDCAMSGIATDFR